MSNFKTWIKTGTLNELKIEDISGKLWIGTRNRLEYNWEESFVI